MEHFRLPQVVKVEDGIYSAQEANTLSAGQILTLHCTKRTDKVLAKAEDGKLFYIPINFPCKVEILPTRCCDEYYSVQDLVDQPTIKFFKVVHNSPPSLGLKAGDILKLVKTFEEYREKYVLCEFCNRRGDLVKLPLSFQAAFVPLAKAETFHLQDFLISPSAFELPVRVKFSRCETLMQDVSKDINLLSLGSVLLKEKLEESTIIATSGWDNTGSVLMIPTDLDVTVHPAEGATNDDKTYARFCRKIHDGADLEKVDLSLSSLVRGGVEAPNVEKLYDYYTEVKPTLPSRGVRVEGKRNGHLPIEPPRPTEQTELLEFFKNLPSDGRGKCLPLTVRNRSLRQRNDSNLDSCKHDNESDLAEQDDLTPKDLALEPKRLQKLATPPKPPGHRMRQAHPHFPSPGEGQDNDGNYVVMKHRTHHYCKLTSTATKPRPSSDNYLEDYQPSDFPDDLSCVSVAELGECLRKLNLEQHVDTFSRNQIDGKLFLTFDKEVLSALGIDNDFEILKFTSFINGWRPRT